MHLINAVFLITKTHENEIKPKRSPLTQGGLEILCTVEVVWDNSALASVLKGLVNQYSVDNNEKDDSSEILEELGGLVNTHMEEEEVQMEQDHDEDIVMINDEAEPAPRIVQILLDSDEDWRIAIYLC